MNKKGFLEELGTYLAVLEEREQQDILEEYAQHIDMKIEKGLSEEEAIRDFGDIRELAAGILEAYHVNPEYQGKHGGRRKTDTESAAVKGRQAWTAAASLFGSAGTMIKRFFSGCAGMLRRAAKHIWTFLTGPWKKGKRRQNRNEGEDMQTEGIRLRRRIAARLGRREEDGAAGGGSCPDRVKQVKRLPGQGMGVGFRRVGHGVSSFLGRCFRLLVWMFLWCIRWCFNGCMILLGLFGGFFTLCMIFIFGMSVVWLFHGYPLLGITLISLGILSCSGSVTYLCFSLIRLKGSKDCYGRQDSQDCHGRQDGQGWIRMQEEAPEQTAQPACPGEQVMDGISKEVRHA
ncbi:DUF1700 domain-containing protein [Enterocloster aldenensis]|uniref:DUF1700 domain-containing protein n=1 Tax=Enterocloster aldenensis TaxID=358742 RepID=UPI000E4A1885|nr:DUF1700 domain-containing protein [Enterocloster aldenensis]